MDYDFCGWVTKDEVRCSDGRIIHSGAFKDNDGKKVPLVWNHLHDDPTGVLGHVILQHRDGGMYGYGYLNDTESAGVARVLLEHKDIDSMSICANKVRESKSGEVYHGNILEVSLVHGGANPEAYIEDVITHSDDEDGTAIIRTAVNGIDFEHAEEKSDDKSETKEKSDSQSDEKPAKTDGEIFDTLTDEQKEVVYRMVAIVAGERIEQSADKNDTVIINNEEEEINMAHNAFEAQKDQNQSQTPETHTFTHSEMQEVIKDIKRYGSLKESLIMHAGDYGINNIEYLFPDAKYAQNGAPAFIKRDTGWVDKVMGRVHHTPFSRVKSLFADITEDEARARGYMKGKLKKEEVFGLLKRSTDPTTVYKKQKLDRDDITDITDFDVVSWLRSEMRMMLDEELARAFLFGDGRLASSDDKINETHIRPIAKDAELYTIQELLTPGATDDDTAKAFIKMAIKSRIDYKGSGQPTLFTTEEMLTNMLLLDDGIGRPLYTDEAALARKMRVSEIVTVPVMNDAKGINDKPLVGLIVNLQDYNVGADRGGAVSMFDGFDIDYNQQKYLIETRCSGALIVPKSAIAIQLDAA